MRAPGRFPSGRGVIPGGAGVPARPATAFVGRAGTPAPPGGGREDRLRTAVVASLSLAVVSLVGVAHAADGPTDLQGRWALVSVESDGKAYPVETPARCQIVGDRLRYGGADLAALAADPSASPNSIDLRFPATERTYEGVYAREKETLKVCLNRRTDGVKERPHVFSTRGRDGWRLLVFRRVADGELDEGATGFVGVALGADPAKAIVVEGLLEDGPAAKSGLKKGDVVLAIDGAAVANLKSAIAAVRAKPGETLTFRVRRDGETKEIKIRAGIIPFTLIADLE